MERNGFLHRVIPWAVAVIVSAAAVGLGYQALAGLLRVPDVPGGAIGTGMVIWTQREVCDESGCKMVPIEGAVEKIRAFVESEMPKEAPRQSYGIGAKVFVVVEDWQRMQACDAAGTVCEDIEVPQGPTDTILRGGEGSDVCLDDFDTGIYKGDGDQVLVIDGRVSKDMGEWPEWARIREMPR